MDAQTLSFVVAFLLLIVLLTIGVNVGIALGMTSIVGTIIYTGNISTGLGMPLLQSISVTTTYSFIVIPLFVLMASLASESNITPGLFKATYQWLGRMPGGAAVATIATCAGMAALTGSSAATSATMSKIAFPELKKMGYDESLSLGAIAVGGTLAIMIPPSVTFVLYAMFAEQSIGQLLIAGILPGIILAILFSFVIIFRSLRNPILAPKAPSFTMKEKLMSLVEVLPFASIILIIVLGILFGLWTPVEAAAVGVIFIFIVGVVTRKLSFKSFINSVVSSIITSSSIIIIIIGSMMFGKFLAISGLNVLMTNFVMSLELPPFVFFIILMVVLIFLGMFLEATSILALTVPILIPIITGIGWNPIWFGVFLVLMMEIAAITPPVGLNLYAVKATLSEVPLERIFRGSIPYLSVLFIMAIVLYFFPNIALFLPSLM